jgi:hypothetical protein
MPEKSYLTENPPKKFNEDENYVEIKPEEVLMQWNAPEYKQYDRPKSWYLILLLIAGILIVISLITANYLLVIITVILAVIVNSITRNDPKDLDDLNSFWILYNPPELKTLNFKRQQRFMPEISIQLEKQNPLKIREFLLEYLEEEIEREEHMADQISRRIGF